MSQFAVPQFIEVEDKIIGPLTLRQFIILLVTTGIVFFLFKLIANLFLFILAALLPAAAGLMLAFSQFNGRPIGSVLFYLLNFLAEPRAFIFNKEVDVLPKISRPREEPTSELPALSSQERLSRLHKLTYILDQDVKEEEQIIKERYVHLR